ncbi:MAG: autotransporter domain-containing protein [Endomicrobium sp.]|nr:autotransporter domain-containing protein [Endomicrobium sp.]
MRKSATIGESGQSGQNGEVGQVGTGLPETDQAVSISGCGGAIYGDKDSKILVAGQTIFQENKAVKDGGAIFVIQGLLCVSGNTAFQENTATSYGGAIAVKDGQGLFQLTRSIEFLDNNIFRPGTRELVVYDPNLIAQYGGVTKFVNNRANDGGGAISGQNSLVVLDASRNFDFEENTARRGGAIYAKDSQVNIDGKRMTFVKNGVRQDDANAIQLYSCQVAKLGNYDTIDKATVKTMGGAVYAESSDVSLTSMSTFSKNEATYGGAIALNKSSLKSNKEGITVNFSNNEAEFGGALYVTDSDLKIGSSKETFIFSENKAKLGGAIFSEKTDIMFEKGVFEFRENESEGGMGVIELTPSRGRHKALRFEGVERLTAIGNKAVRGGFIGAANSQVYIGGKDISIKENKARVGNGGAIYTNLGRFVIEGGGEISNNSAVGLGGAIFSQNGEIIIKSTIGEGIIFRENVMNSVLVDSTVAKANDVYLGAGSSMVLNAEKPIKMLSGVGGVEGSEIVKKGEGVVYLDGNIKYEGLVRVQEGLLEMQAKEAQIGRLEIEERGEYIGKEIHRLEIGELNIKGRLGVNINLDTKESDKFVVEGSTDTGARGITTLCPGSSYFIRSVGKLEEDEMKEVRFKEVIKSSEIVGNFKNSKYRTREAKYEMAYYQDSIDLIVRYVTPPPKSKVGEVPAGLESKTKNGKKIARLINEVYLKELENRDIDIEGLPSENLAARLINLPIGEREKAVEGLHGEFYADLMLGLADNNNNGVLFNRLNESLMTYESHQRVWANGLMYNKELEAEETPLVGEFKIREAGAIFGLDICQKKDKVIGLYGEYNADDIWQDKNKGTASSIGIGVYGLKALDRQARFNLKMAMAYNRANVQVHRNVDIGGSEYNPSANFGIDVLKSGIEVEKGIKVEEVELKPYCGVEGGIAFNNEIEEENGGETNLLLGRGNIGRIYATIGVNVEYKASKILGLHSKVGLKRAVYGERGYIKAEMPKVREGKFEVESEVDRYIGGVDLGLEYKMGRNVTMFINSNIYGGSSSQYATSVGFSYRIPVKTYTDQEYDF